MSAPTRNNDPHMQRIKRLASQADRLLGSVGGVRLEALDLPEAARPYGPALIALADAVVDGSRVGSELAVHAAEVLRSASGAVARGESPTRGLPPLRAHDRGFAAFDTFVRIWSARADAIRSSEPTRSSEVIDLTENQPADLAGTLAGVLWACILLESELVEILVQLGFDAPLVAGATDRLRAWARDTGRVCESALYELACADA